MNPCSAALSTCPDFKHSTAASRKSDPSALRLQPSISSAPAVQRSQGIRRNVHLPRFLGGKEIKQALCLQPSMSSAPVVQLSPGSRKKVHLTRHRRKEIGQRDQDKRIYAASWEMRCSSPVPPAVPFLGSYAAIGQRDTRVHYSNYIPIQGIQVHYSN